MNKSHCYCCLIYWLTPFVQLWWGQPSKITLALAVAVALALALTLKVSESPLIGPGGQPLSLWSCFEIINNINGPELNGRNEGNDEVVKQLSKSEETKLEKAMYFRILYWHSTMYLY